jgi:hypothetical protein
MNESTRDLWADSRTLKNAETQSGVSRRDDQDQGDPIADALDQFHRVELVSATDNGDLAR